MGSTDDEERSVEEELDDEMKEKGLSKDDDDKVLGNSDSDNDDDIEIEITEIDYRKKIDTREVTKKGWLKKLKNPPVICLNDHMAPFRQLLWEMKDKTKKEKKEKIGGLLKGQAKKVLMAVTGEMRQK